MIEEEGTDDMSGDGNAVGALEALRRADETVGVIRAFVEGRTDTLMLMAADSDAGGLQVLSGREARAVGGLFSRLSGQQEDLFLSVPDAQGVRHPFRIAYAGSSHIAGGTLVRAAGFNADRVEPLMDNTDGYQLRYETLFGIRLSQCGNDARTKSRSLPADARATLTSGTDFVVVCDGTRIHGRVVAKIDGLGQISACQGTIRQCPVPSVMPPNGLLC